MAEVLANQLVAGTLSADITSGSTSIVLVPGDGAKFPTSGIFRVLIDSEIITITSRSVDTLTVANRGVESTTAAAHVAGVKVRLVLTAAALTTAFIPSTGGTLTGPLLTTDRIQGALATITSANDLSLGNANLNSITGTTQLNRISSTGWQQGSIVTLVFNGSITIKHNQTGAGALLPILLFGAADYVANANSTLTLAYIGTNWVEVNRTITGLATVDTVPPTFSSIASGSISATGALITWTTNENSDSQVEYGTTTSYGSSTTLDTSLVLSHSQSLSGLSASTTYHYRVKSRDAAGNLGVSADFTFTTTATTSTLLAQYNATSSGGTMNVVAGIYREATLVVSKPITIIGPAADLRGSDDWSPTAGVSWTLGGGYYTSSLSVPVLPTTYVSPVNDTDPRANWPEQVFLDGVEQFQLITGSTPGAGQFCLNSNVAGSRFVRLGTNPAGKLVEVTTRQILIDIQSTAVNIKGTDRSTMMKFKHGAPNYQYGLINCRGTAANGYTLPNIKFCDISYSHGAGIANYGGEQIVVEGCEIHHNGLIGLDMGAYNAQFDASGVASTSWAKCVPGAKIGGTTTPEQNFFHHNVTQGGNTGWHAGDIKVTMMFATSVKTFKIQGNAFEDSSKGIWCDTRCAGIQVLDNFFKRIGLTTNADTVHFEVSDAQNHGATSADNTTGMVLQNNKFEKCWSTCIIDSCLNVKIIGNKAAWCQKGWDIHWYGLRSEIASNGGYMQPGPKNIVFGTGNEIVWDNAISADTSSHAGFFTLWREDNGGTMSDSTNGVPTSGTRNGLNKYNAVTVSGTTITWVADGTGGAQRYETNGYARQTSMSAFAAVASGQWGGGSSYLASNTAGVNTWLSTNGFIASPNS